MLIRMAEYAPQAIMQLYAAIEKHIPEAQLSGVMGDKAHTYGYHRARAVLPSSDYSVKLPDDRKGNPWAASALDITLPPGLMKLVTRRLRDAIKAGDPRVKAIREIGGTLDGNVTYSIDAPSGIESYGQWSRDHMWHEHISFLRRYADNANVLLPIADVIAGISPEKEFVVDDAAKKEFAALRKEIKELRDYIRNALIGHDGDAHRIETLVIAGASIAAGKDGTYPAARKAMRAQKDSDAPNPTPAAKKVK